MLNINGDKCFRSDPFMLYSLKLTSNGQSNDNATILLISCSKYTNKIWNLWNSV